MGTNGHDLRNWQPAGGFGNLVSGGFGTQGGTFNYDSGWSASYDAVGDLLGVSFSGGYTASTPGNVSAVTGVNPVETSYALYGHLVPLLAIGQARIGGDIISGPVLNDTTMSGINSFGVQADPTRVLTLVEIAFDSQVVWQGTCVGDPNAPVTPDASGFTTEPFTCRFYTGSLTQPADAFETAQWGANAVAYRGQVLLALDNLPIAATKFKKYPYIACKFVDEDGAVVNFGELFERIAYSPYCGLTSDQFETDGITDGVVDGGIIITDNTDFLSLLQQFCRFYPTWDLLQTDKLRLVDRGDEVEPDITLDETMLIEEVGVSRQGEDTRRKDIELTTIDPDADYTLLPFATRRPRDPIAVSNSVGKDSAYLPVIMDAATRASVATFANYHEENSRRMVSFKAMFIGFEVEPGARVRLDGIGDNFRAETFKIKETLHGANYTVECTAQPILDCQIVPPTTWDADTALQVTLSGGDLVATSTGTTGHHGVRANSSRSSGKYYFEMTITNLAASGVNVDTAWGVAMDAATYSGICTNAALAATVYQSGGLICATSFVGGNLGQLATGDVLGFAIDFTNSRFWVRKAPSGSWEGNGSAANPATNTNGGDMSALSGALTPVSVYGGLFATSGDITTANFGASSFVGAVPSGFTSGWPL